MPTLADVAKVAGVGVMSVSRVVNGTRRVSPEIERKVRAAIERIGYEPNQAARILKGNRSRLLGLIVPELADPFFATCANAVQEAAWDAGFMTLMAASGHKEDRERRETEIMVQHRVAGLLIIPSGVQNDHFVAAQKSGTVIVSIDRPLVNVDADSLVVDNRAAADRVVQHLIDHGHRNVVCLADDEIIFTKTERVTGYLNAMRRSELSPRVCLVGPSTGSMSDQLSFVLESNPAPSAIFAASNLVAGALLRELQRRSITIPDQIALICFDDFDAATLIQPRITVVRQPTGEIGRQAALLLLQRLDSTIDTEKQHTVLATELVIRESCGCPAVPYSG
jgi:LacI family transcriptional regulator